MKKFSILLVVIIIAAAAAGIALYSSNKKFDEPPRSKLYQSAGEVVAEIERLEAVRDSSTLTWQDSFLLGVAYMHAARNEAAAAALEASVREYPRFAPARESLGMVYFRLGRFARAADTWGWALALDPAAVHLEEMITGARRRVAVNVRVVMLEGTIKDKTAGWREKFELSSLYMLTGRLDEAETLLVDVAEEKGDVADVHMTLAEVRRMKGDARGALEAAKKALSIKPDDGEIKGALKALEKAVAGPGK